MCRNIKTLFNFEPPATELEIRDASLQFVRKLSGFSVPSKANEAAFDQAVEQVAVAARKLIQALVTTADPKDREVEAARARASSACVEQVYKASTRPRSGLRSHSCNSSTSCALAVTALRQAFMRPGTSVP